ncbi:MAG TPA: aspartyl protease family protein [Usitatibacter sp.]|nr:aspartyl protease family protein [Usitatibacter sp.]
MRALSCAATILLAIASAAHAANVRVFEQARGAAGGAAWEHVRSLVAEGPQESPGMKGTWREVVDFAEPRMMHRDDFGIVRYDSVWSGSTHWRQANGGGVHALDSEFGKQAARTELWLAQRRYLQADGAGAAVSAEESRKSGDAAFVAVTATPVDGQPVELWFDPATHLLARTVRRMNVDTETKQYSDYREVEGVKLPFRIVDGDDPASASTSVASSYRLNAASEAELARPQPRKDWTVAGGSTSVPIGFDGYVVVRARINGKLLEFILDTGGHDILTPAAVAALGLRPEGAGLSGGSGEGKVTEQYVRVDRLQIGSMTMRDQVFTVLPMPHGSVERDPRPPLSGIIGLELFERFAVKIDYRRKRLTLTPLETYRHTGPGTALPLFFNDDEPLVKAALMGRTGDFGIDTGNTGSLIVQGRWAKREGLSQGLEKGLDVTGFGMGGASHNWASRADFEIGGAALPRILTRYSNDNGGSFASIVEAGNVGNDILANFTVEFDYGRGELWFLSVPGFTAPPFSRAGLSVTKDRPDAFIVASVVRGGPSAEAGLKAGDFITRVDGIPAANLSLTDLGRRVRQAPGTRVAFEVERKGEHLAPTVTLRELLP